MYRYKSTFLLLVILAVLIAACAPKSAAITVYCDRIVVRYIAGGDDGAGGGPLSYLFQAVRASDDVVVGSATGPYLPEDAEYEVTIQLDRSYDEGTSFYVQEVYNSDGIYITGAEPCDSEGGGVTWFEPGDNRINRQAYAYAAVYCDDENARVGIYGIHSSGAGERDDGTGFPAIFVPYDALPPTPDAATGNVFIEQFDNIRFYRLTSGEYQINVGPDSEGKEYVLIWDGCPSSTIRAYMMQNGVMSLTEIYPRPE